MAVFETEPPPLINGKPYQLLVDAREAEEIQRLDKGEMMCPSCGPSLTGDLVDEQT